MLSRKHPSKINTQSIFITHYPFQWISTKTSKTIM
nr:MAG TPA: hypothetical protein [Bacteriophage sp.]